MEHRQLGVTGLTVSRIGLGLAALGRPGYINLGHADDLNGAYEIEAMRHHAFEVLDAAWQGGVRYFDAARSYGRAEEFLAAWLTERSLPGDQVTVGSKWGYTYTAGWRIDADVHEIKDHTLPTLERQQRESREILNPWLKLYQIHSATLASGVLDRPEVLDRLADLKEAGLAIGLTLSGPGSGETLERALAIERHGRRLFDSVQATWNLLEPSLSSALQSAHQNGIGVIVKEALANGRLTPRNEDRGFAPKRLILEREAQRLGCTIDQLALAAALDQPWTDCVLSGAATIGHARSNVGALSVALDDEARSALAELAEPVDSYWTTRGELPWT